MERKPLIVGEVLEFNYQDFELLSQKAWEQDVNKHNQKYFELRDKESISTEDIQLLIENKYTFWFKIINDECYKKDNDYLIELTLSYINRPITLYINKSMLLIKLVSFCK